jgi:hypothetical protein
MTEKLEVICVADIKPRPRRRNWNGWTLTHGSILSYPAYSGGDYSFDLTDFSTSAKMLNMIIQMEKKTWATDRCVAGLIHALNDILRPQAYLCGSGIDKRLSPSKIKDLCNQSRWVTRTYGIQDPT